MFEYLKHPTATVAPHHLTIGEKTKRVFGVYVACLAFEILVGLCILLPIDVVVNIFYDYSILDASRQAIPRALQKYGSLAFFIMVILGPLLEEIIFRLPLKLERFGISLSVGLLSYYFSGSTFEINFYESKLYLRIAITIATMAIVHKFLPENWLATIKAKFYGQYFYLVAFLFALIHITNLSPYNTSVLFFYPIFTLPQFIIGLFIGYARMKYGFFSGWCIHALMNLTVFLHYAR
jgi:membrane protease YdiL (CAAX protease family)